MPDPLPFQLYECPTLWARFGNWTQELNISCYMFAEDSKRFKCSGVHAPDVLEKDATVAYGSHPHEAVSEWYRLVCEKRDNAQGENNANREV